MLTTGARLWAALALLLGLALGAQSSSAAGVTATTVQVGGVAAALLLPPHPHGGIVLACRRRRQYRRRRRRRDRPARQPVRAHPRRLCRARLRRAGARLLRRCRCRGAIHGAIRPRDAGWHQPRHPARGARHRRGRPSGAPGADFGIPQRRLRRQRQCDPDRRLARRSAADADRPSSPRRMPQDLARRRRAVPGLGGGQGAGGLAGRRDSEGDPCEAFAHHGFNGLDGQVVSVVSGFAAR